MTASDIRGRLVTNCIAAVADMHGFSPREVEEFERLAGKPLPLAYRQFLEAVGHGAGTFLQGTSVFYGQVTALTDAQGRTDTARDLLAKNGFEGQLPDDAFVFYLHQEYEFGYFRIGEGDNPPVYQYWEGSDRPPQLAWPSFTDYLVEVIGNRMEALRRMARD